MALLNYRPDNIETAATNSNDSKEREKKHYLNDSQATKPKYFYKAKCRFPVAGLLMMKLLLSKELQIICRLILVQRLIWCVQAGQFAGKIDQAFSRIAAERLTVGSEFEAGNQLAIKSGLRLSNEWIKRLVRSDFQNRNLIRSNRESIDRPGLTHEINLLNSVLKRTNVTNHLVGTKLSPLSGLSDSSIDLHRLNEPNELVKSAKLFEFNGLDEGQSKRRIDELANNNSDRPANRSNRFAAATQSKRSREASVRGREESSMLDNGSSEEEEDELYEIPSAGIVALAVCYMTISLCAIVGNLIVLFIVIKSKKMQNPTNYLLANLSASDFLIGNPTFSLILIFDYFDKHDQATNSIFVGQEHWRFRFNSKLPFYNAGFCRCSSVRSVRPFSRSR